MRDFSFYVGRSVLLKDQLDCTVNKVADENNEDEGKKVKKVVVVVAGPVVIHSGGATALAALIKRRFISEDFSEEMQIAVHDMESVFFGTSLGVCQKNRQAYKGRP